MRIAIVGAGISGLGAAWALHRDHDIAVYEANDYPGGHANTVEVETQGRRIAVDTGFIVYNEPNYPNLTALFDHLGVPTQPSTMSFAASLDGGRFEYAGSGPGLFVQKSNLVRPRLWRMVRDVLRFYREAPALLEYGHDPAGDIGLGAFLSQGGYSETFVRDHLMPMAAAIWSGTPQTLLAFPARSFAQFFRNHGLLKLWDRPQWRTVTGGSRVYVETLTAPFADRIRLNAPVASIARTPDGVLVKTADGHLDRFDQVVLASHADQTLALLGDDATARERALLGAFRYEANRAILHQDETLMPKRRGVWSSWNYVSQSRADEGRAVSVTYWMNRLQSIDEAVPLFVSLNPLRAPKPESVLFSTTYMHPQYDLESLQAQRALPEIQGVNRTWFCGSYCGYGFHEDGLSAGLSVAAALGAPAPWTTIGVAPRDPAPLPVAAE